MMPTKILATTILDIIRMVLPDGTKEGSTGWDAVSDWPPDLFAVTAEIAERSGLYSEPMFTANWQQPFICNDTHTGQTIENGKKWAETGIPPRLVQSLWKELLSKYRNARIDDDIATASSEWKKIVFSLLTIADEACAGIGFFPRAGRTSPLTKVQYLYCEEYVAWDKRSRSSTPPIQDPFLPYLPHSVCMRVPPAVLCVQPKTCTPLVGCTLRSLSHHLALLPSVANVKTHWHLATKGEEGITPFNILAVPFPFSIPGKSFSAVPDNFPGMPSDPAFALDPSVWMRGATGDDVAKFLIELIDAGGPELEPIHAVILPEAALNLQDAEKAARVLAARSSVDLFVTGVIAEKARNSAAFYRFIDGQIAYRSFQSKHHRWLLENNQIRRYHLGHVLSPHRNWWEKIDVSYRECYVNLFRAGATMSVLVCEDLARYDPVLTVMNAIGPNLVVALLMDGPQIEHRWPGRYATVLADDPGSSVLTLTSFGMVARSTMPGEPENREIALWKEPQGDARALKLPKDAHGLLLTLTCKEVSQVSLDGRTDNGATIRLGLGGARGVRHPHPPAWLGL